MIILNNKIFEISNFENENELGEVIKNNSTIIFGKYSLYLSEFSVSTTEGKTSIPDAIVIDFENEVWYVIEFELKSHSVWNHIIPQVTKHLVAVSNPSEKEKIAESFMELIKQNENYKKMLKNELGIQDTDIWRKLEIILNKKPVLLIVIDGIRSDLKEWQNTINVQSQLIEVTKYVSKDGEVAYYIPDYALGLKISEENEDEEGTKQAITFEEFQRRCKQPICELYKKLNELESKYSGLLKIRPTQSAISFKVKTKEKPYTKWNTIFTIYPDSIYVLKYNKENFARRFGENVEKFFQTLRKIEAIDRVFDIMSQPGVKSYNLTLDDIDIIIEAIEILLK